MENDNILYTVSVYTENQVGLLSAISIIFTRRNLNIWSLTVSASAIEGVHKFTIATRTSRKKIEAAVKQLEKRVDVIKAFFYENDEIIYREVALLKVSTEDLLESNALEEIVNSSHARIVEMNRKFMVIQKTGHCDDTMDLYRRLNRVCKVLQFVRSGRVAVTRSEHEFVDEFLQERAKEMEIINKQ